MDLTLRHWTEDDAADINAAVAESVEHLKPWMPWASAPPMTLDERKAWIREMSGRQNEVFGTRLDGEIVGACGFHRRVGPRALEIGYWVHGDHVCRGIATEMVRRLTEMAFAREDIDHVEIHHDRANIASQRVAIKAGFTHVLDRPEPRQGPADSGTERVWRLAR